MGTQKNRLNETVILSTQNICLILWVRKYLQFYAEIFCLSKSVMDAFQFLCLNSFWKEQNYHTSILTFFIFDSQAFRFMVGRGHCPMISKYGPSLSKAVGQVDPSFLGVKKSLFNKKYSSYSKSANFTKQKIHVGCQYSKTCHKQPLKKTKQRS